MQKKVCVALRDLLSFFVGTMCFHVSLVLGELSAVFHMFHALEASWTISRVTPRINHLLHPSQETAEKTNTHKFD